MADQQEIVQLVNQLPKNFRKLLFRKIMYCKVKRRIELTDSFGLFGKEYLINMHEENQQNSKYLWGKMRTYVSDDKLPKKAYTVNQLLFIWAIRNYHYCRARCSLA